MLHDEIQKAIGAHGLWKSRLRRAIQTGASEFTSEGVKVDNKCDFGRWLHALPATQRDPHYKRVLQLHAEFHREASGVLQRVESGDRAGAEKAMAEGSNFDRLTIELTRAMMDWRKAA